MVLQNIESYEKALGPWGPLLREELHKAYFESLVEFLREERNKYEIYPPKGQVFTALHLTPLESVKVLILGQDPYHGPGQAHGLSFSVPQGIKIPPSLKNIFREMESDLGIAPPKNGDLTPWAKQGVMLLNAVLTVRAHQANAHKNKGWEKFTDAIIRKISEEKEHVVFVLWGGYAKKKKRLIHGRHTIVESVHPSPLSAKRGFFGSRPFSKIQEALKSHGQTEINWALSDNGSGL